MLSRDTFLESRPGTLQYTAACVLNVVVVHCGHTDTVARMSTGQSDLGHSINQDRQLSEAQLLRITENLEWNPVIPKKN